MMKNRGRDLRHPARALNRRCRASGTPRRRCRCSGEEGAQDCRPLHG